MMQRDIGTDTITLVNVFEIAPDQLDSFLDAWRARAEFMSAQPGFRSLRVLRAVSTGARF
jgi:heme-degrading monooxygenase HmoA